LIAIEQEHLLGQLFEKVFVPVAVREELTDAKTPETVRRRVLELPAWFDSETGSDEKFELWEPKIWDARNKGQ
jgi:predicted nucleic acid-binding protein